jgi:hypothetical protein
MIINSMGVRATSNLRLLELVARRLGKLNDSVVYLGGCATALFINDPSALDVRSTIDVDCIIDVISLTEYYKFETQLSEKGFKKFMEDDVICRFRYDELILDVMPTDQKILGFGNRWYREALQNSVTHVIAPDLNIKSISAPYFLATKFEAFKTRGNNDLVGSHDYEDIISVIAGRTNIVEEVAEANFELQQNLKEKLKELLQNDQFEQTLPGHLNDGPATMQNVQVVINRFNQIVNNE